MFTLDSRSLSRCLIAAAIGVALSACGGGGGSGTPQNNSPPTGGVPNPPVTPPIPEPPKTSTITGVAAVGAPLTGTVTVKDAAGVTKTVAIGTNGSYSIDVTGLTAPFVFRAEGTANGRTYVVHSAAAAADVNGAINITQLTDLVVSNIAGQIASNYFDGGNFGSLSKTALDAEVGKLKEKLLPVLTALGVDSSIDLLRTQFTPLSSAVDSALDILRVSVDSQSNVATITNIVTQQQIQDDLAVAAAAEASPAQLTDTTGVTTGVSDVAAIKAALATFSAKFATSLPSPSSVEAAFTNTFVFDDLDGATFASELAVDPSMLGSKFTDVDVTKIDYTDLTHVVATVDFTAMDKDGVEMDRLRGFKLVKDANGNWLLHGNRRIMEITAEAHMMSITNGGTNCRITGLEFDFEDFDGANNGGAIDHFMVSGPGLPQDGLRYNQPAMGGFWPIAGQAFPYYTLASSCQQSQALTDTAIAAIPDDAKYKVVAYSSADNSAKLDLPGGLPDGSYVLTIEKRPLTLAEVKATDDFPVIATPADPAALASFAGGDLDVSITGAYPGTFVDVFAQLNTAGDDFQEADAYLAPTSDGKLDVELTFLAPAQNDQITWRQLAVSSLDMYRRSMMTIYSVGTR